MFALCHDFAYELFFHIYTVLFNFQVNFGSICGRWRQETFQGILAAFFLFVVNLGFKPESPSLADYKTKIWIVSA